MMSDAVAPLKGDENFKSILTMFSNPILGVLAGTLLTAIVQSSSASVGILQSLTATGAITFGAALPIIMGQNIGTCVTALISSAGASKNGKRAAFVHLYFNIIGVVLFLSGFYAVKYFANLDFSGAVNSWDIAATHTIFKIVSVILLFPATKLLVKLSTLTVKDGDEDEHVNLLDERLIATPSIAIEYSEKVTRAMAKMSCDAMRMALESLKNYDTDKAEQIRSFEEKADTYEDSLGSYLVRISDGDLTPEDSHQVTKLLHLIGDFERISDHAVNVLESAEEMKDKKISFSPEAQKEIAVMTSALSEIISLADKAYEEGDLATAAMVEPLEQVIDSLKVKIKLNHVLRLQNNECTIEHGFVLSDLLTNFERVSDHCSNIAGCLLEMSSHNALDMHKYLGEIKGGNDAEFQNKFNSYKEKYSI